MDQEILNSSPKSSMTRRRFLTNSALAVGATVGANSLLAACGSSGSSGPVTLTAMYTTTDLTPAYVTAFEKLNPNIKVNLIDYDATRLSAMLAAGGPPDFIRTQGAPEMPNFIARGLALDITSYLQKSTALSESNLEAVNGVYRFDGHTQGQGSYYGVAKDWSQDAMLWYNTDLFDKAKVPYISETEPITYDELLELGKRLTVRKNGKIQVYGLNSEWGFIQQGHMLQMLAQKGLTLFNSDMTQIDFTTPDVKAVFQWFIDWAQAHVGQSPLDPDPTWDGDLYNADRVAIAIYGYWFGGQIFTGTDVKSHSAFAPAPQWGPQRVSSCMGGTGAWIPQNTKHPDEAFKLMEYYMGGQPAVDRSKSGSGIPSLKSLVSNLPQTLPYQKQAFQTQQQELPYLSILHFSPYADYTSVEAAITKFIEPVMHGQATLDTATQQLTSYVNNLMSVAKQNIG